MSCGRRGFGTSRTRARPRRRGTYVSPGSFAATVCKILGQEELKPHKVRYYLERRDAEFEQKMAEVLCVYRKVQVLKRAAAKSRKAIKRVAIVSCDSRGSWLNLIEASSQIRAVGLAPHPGHIKTRTQTAHHGCNRRHKPSSRRPYLVIQTRQSRLK